ncbi:MAG: 7TM-DISM domain-containing protein [Chitinophagales bacterium]
MKNVLLFIFIVLCSKSFFGTVINIDSNFKQAEIYNTHKCNRHDSLFILQIKNNTSKNQQLYLSIINPTIDCIEIQTKDTTVFLGDAVPFSDRVFKHSNFVFPVLLKSNESTELKVKVRPQWEPLAFKIKLDSENSFVKHTNHDNIFLGFFLGIFFMFLMLLMCFYIYSKSNYFLIYSIINFFSLLCYFLYLGIGSQYMWWFSASIQKYIIVIAAVGYFISHIFFIKSFFTAQFLKNIYQTVLNIIIVVCLLFSVTLFILEIIKTPYFIGFKAFYYVIHLLLVIYTATVFLMAFYAFRESKRREVLWIVLTMSMHLLNWFIFLNTIYGYSKILNTISALRLFNSSIFVSQANIILTASELFIISLFIVYNYHFLVRKNNLSYKRLEYLQKRNINIFVLGQEEEREKITHSIESSLKIDIEKLQEQIQYFQTNSSENKVIPTVLKDLKNTLQDLKNITSNYVTPDLQNMLYQELIYTSTDKLNAEKEVSYIFENIKDNFKLNAIANAHIYRVCQELSNNIFKHANASNVTIHSKIDQNDLILKFTDNGKGFTDNNQKGLGLLNIESRINSLNGNIYFLSSEKKGTSIHIILNTNHIS